MTIPSANFYSSLLITAELGEIDWFVNTKQVVSYAGLDPDVRKLGDSQTVGSISKHGYGDLRWIPIHCTIVVL